MLDYRSLFLALILAMVLLLPLSVSDSNADAKPRPVDGSIEKPRATWYYQAGLRAMNAFKRRAAEKLFRQCLDLDRSYAGCHKWLGIVYAGRGWKVRACYRFRSYIRLRPDAPDAGNIGRLIKRSCGLKRY